LKHLSKIEEFGKVQQLQLNMGKWEKLLSNLGENKNI